MASPESAQAVGTGGALELLALECDGCKAYVPLTKMRGIDRVTRKHVRSSHAGRPHEGCLAKGTWHGKWQQSLLLGSTTRDPRDSE